VSGAGPGPVVPTPYPALTAASILLPADAASCHPAGQVDRKPQKAVSPGHGAYLRNRAWPDNHAALRSVPPGFCRLGRSVRGRSGDGLV